MGASGEPGAPGGTKAGANGDAIPPTHYLFVVTRRTKGVRTLPPSILCRTLPPIFRRAIIEPPVRPDAPAANTASCACDRAYDHDEP